MPHVSNRSQEIPLSPFRKLIPFADQAKARGVHVYHLNIGQPDIETPARALQKVRDIELNILAYSPAIGNKSYREKLLTYYAQFDMQLNADEVIVTTGASEAIRFLFLSCFDPGDEVIIPEPFYANYNGFAQMYDVKIKPIACHIESGFALPDIKGFEAAITDKTKGIFITNPSNPTGALYGQSKLEELGRLAQTKGIFLIADEVYREFCYDGQSFHSILNLPDIGEHAIVIDSISKRFSACGARIGALLTRNQQVVAAVTRYAKLRLSPPGLGQILAEGTLEMDHTYLEEVQEEYDRRRMVVYNRLQQMPGVLSYRPGGAFYCFARFPVDSAEAFCRWMLEEFSHEGATTMVSPGEGFYATPGRGIDEVRIAYVLNTTDLKAAMDCLEEGLRVYPGRK